jgi:outer membrane receptor protein involved in Fe transport
MWAQEDSRNDDESDVFQLDVFEVTADDDIGYQSTRAGEVSRMNTAISDIPMSVTILNQEFMEDTMAQSTEDVLQYIPGFIPESNNDNWVIRGFANANTKFLNGFLQQESIGKVSIANIERIEVLRGPAAVLWGEGGYAATVNRVTKRPLDTRHTMLRGGYGPNDTVRFELDHGGPIGESKFAYRITGVYDHGEYYRDLSHDEDAIGGSLRWQISKKTRVTFEHLHVEETDGGAVWRQPMMRGDYSGFTLADGTYLPYGDNRQGYSSPTDIREWKRTFSMIDIQHAFNSNIALRIQAARDTKDQYYRETQPEQGSLTILKDAVLMPRRWRIRIQDVENYRSRNELVSTFRTGPASHRLLLGFSWDQSDAEINNNESGYNRGGASGSDLADRWPRNPGQNIGKRFNEFPDLTLAEFLADVALAGFNPHMIPPVNVINPKQSPPVEALDENRPPLRNNRDDDNLTINKAIYAADMISFDQERFFLTAGVRRTRAYDRRFDKRSDQIVDEGKVYSTTYSFGTVYHIKRDESLTFYANANSSFIPEFRRQPDGSALPAEEGNQIEAGLRFSLNDSRIQGMLSLYEINQENIAENDPESEEFILIDGIRSRGLEFSLNGQITKNFRVYGGYAYTDARDTSDDSRVYAVPYHHFSAFSRYTVDLRHRENLDFMLGSIYVGSRPIQPQVITSIGGAENAPNWDMPGVLRFDYIMRYKIRPKSGGPRYEVRMKIQNVLDEQEIVKRADRVSFQLQPGRTFQIDFRVRF